MKQYTQYSTTIALAALFLSSSLAFPLSSAPSSTSRPNLSVCQVASAPDVAYSSLDGGDTSKTLNFLSKFGAKSKPLPATSPENAVAFFRQPKNLSFGDSMPSEVVVPTPGLIEEWYEACQKVGVAAVPNPERDLMLRVRTAGIKIPGLTVEWSAHIGTTLVQCEDTMLPTLEFVLIKDEMSARGIAPLMWMFERATKPRRNNNNNTTKQRDTRFLSRISLGPTSTYGNDRHAFSCDGTMEMRFAVPNVLRNAMGKDKSKHEARISKLITRQIEKDMVKAVAKWHSTYESWISQQ